MMPSTPRHLHSAAARTRRAGSVASSTPPCANSAARSYADSIELYTQRDTDLDFIAQLGRSDGAQHVAEVREHAHAPAQSEVPSDAVLVFCSEGSIRGVAYLLPDAPRLGQFACDDSDDDDEIAWDDSDDEEEVECDDADDDEDEDEGHNTVTGESSNNGSSNDKDNEDEAEEDGDDDWGYYEEYDAKKLEMKPEPAYSLKLKVWPLSGYAIIVLFDGGAWVSTSSYSLSWLSSTEAQIIVEKLADPSQVGMKVNDSLLVSNAMLLSSGEYEGVMVNSVEVETFVNFKLRPSLYHFNVHDILGKGAYCNVRLCTAGDQKDYAMKIIKSEENDLDEPREVAILSSLRSPFVVKFFQAWIESHIFVSYEECSSSSRSSQCDDSRENGEAPTDIQRPRYILILMELCEGTLANYLSTKSREVDAEKSLEMFKEIVQGVQYVHGQNVIHRDLKPSNVFLGKDNKLKLGDFGQSRVQPRYIVSFKVTPGLGTIFYEAPELKAGERISDKVDVYPLGVIYLELFSKFNTGMDVSKTFKIFRDNDASTITWDGDIFLFKQMVSSDPVKRPSVNDVLEHISQVRSSLQKTEASYIVNGLDQPGESEEVNLTENRDSAQMEEADTPRGETRA